ncbi:MAG TPA: ABC transporter permease [Candidatus Nitrosotalea sp.]|nr:ABC transporter permease [Candidatus Nitrosotalea sp.]
MRAVMTVARLTIWEASRRRLLLALVLLTLAIVVLTGWGYSRLWTVRDRGLPVSAVEVRLLTSQILILITFVFAAVLALSSILVAAPSISGEIESGLALSILARPLYRAQWLLGKWFGLAFLVVLYALAAGWLELLAADLTTGYMPPHPWPALALVMGEGLVLLTLSLALSTRLAGMTAGIISLVCYFMAWVGGIVAGVGLALHNAPLSDVGGVSRLLLPTDGLWRGAVWALEPASVLALAHGAGPAAAANPFLVADPPAPAFLAWAGVWIVLVLGLAVLSLRSREL